MTEFHMNAILPIALYTAFRSCCLSAETTPFTGEACEINCSLVRTENCWKTRRAALFAAIWYLCASGIVWVSTDKNSTSQGCIP